jgi:hypothetical protein
MFESVWLPWLQEISNSTTTSGHVNLTSNANVANVANTANTATNNDAPTATAVASAGGMNLSAPNSTPITSAMLMHIARTHDRLPDDLNVSIPVIQTTLRRLHHEIHLAQLPQHEYWLGHHPLLVRMHALQNLLLDAGGSFGPLVALNPETDLDGSQSDGKASESSNHDEDVSERCKQERLRIRANWDPSYPSEGVSWYDEYIHRHAPTVVNWFEPARKQSSDGKWTTIEARGVALYNPDNSTHDATGLETLLAISPLDDGSICIWDVNGTKSRKGSVFAKSKPGLLFIDGPHGDNNRASKRVDSGVTECVSVDNQRHRAFFAVQSRESPPQNHSTPRHSTLITKTDLVDVDLQTMSVVGCESFPWSITALSSANATIPLTIATSLGIHLHDYRSRASTPVDDEVRVDGFGSTGAQYYYEQGLRNLFADVPLPPYAPLAQPGSLSILHLQEPGSLADLSDDIYVAGRFTSILHYDRRMFPSIKDTIYSGGSLCSMTSSPYPFSGLCSERRRRGQMSVEDVDESKKLPGGRTLIACGDYNHKGSLEIYGLSPSPDTSGKMEVAGHQNRYTASGAKLLSVVNHGARIAVSDAMGYIKWFERDGFTEIRRCRLDRREPPHNRIGEYWEEGRRHSPGGMARKILPTGAPKGAKVNANDLLFWTGDKLGAVGFSTQPGTMPRDFFGPEEADERSEEARRYEEAMMQGLLQHADQQRWLAELGLGDMDRS